METGAIVFTVTTLVTSLTHPEAFTNWYLMVAAPDETPLTIPLVEFTVATAVLSLDHVPPDVVFAYVVVAPTQTLFAPVIGDNT